MTNEADIYYMKTALSLANRGIGRTAPNPSVGCVIVKDDIVISRGNTADGGRPHAETIALENAGEQAKCATMYVTLEPCTHHGKTPPCIDAIIKAGISRVVIGANDVDPRVAGKSAQLLKKAGIEVSQGILKNECNEVNAGFINRITKNRPYITLKMACSLDGKIALASGESQWITGDLARSHVHLMRSRHDAILVGIGTVLADNPTLTTHIKSIDHNPVRIVLDSKLRTPLDSNLVKTSKSNPLWILHNADNNTEKLTNSGVILHKIDCRNLVSILGFMAKNGANRLFIEGGSEIHSSFLHENLCDELLIYRSPKILGGKAKPLFSNLSVDILANSYNFKRKSVITLGEDMLEIYKCSQD